MPRLKRKALSGSQTQGPTTAKSKKTPDADGGPRPTCWLIKSEPESRIERGVDVKFSLDDLRREPQSTACWDGVRNYQARNNMRAMLAGQRVFFYHSNCKEPAIVGLVEVVKEAYPDHTQVPRQCR